MDEKKVLEFHKEVGGYLTVVKFNNVWHYAHDSGTEHVKFLNRANEKGYCLNRVQGQPPKSVLNAYKKHGRTNLALKKSLPLFDINWL